jgi:glucokinase
VTTISGEDAKLKDEPNTMKIVVGPGTGLGQGLLIKSDDVDGYYNPFPAEGGHTDFSVKSEEDWELMKFARDFIENSDNIENQRCRRHVTRLSIESLCAGPAVPLLYAFMKKTYPDLPAVLEQDSETHQAKQFDDIVSKDIISLAMEKKDPLCMKVVEKFAEIYGTEVGNSALNYMPYGGIYLIGGVTNGIKDYMVNESMFMDNFLAKGRLSGLMKNFKVMIVNAELEVGLLGAQEAARREMMK